MKYLTITLTLLLLIFCWPVWAKTNKTDTTAYHSQIGLIGTDLWLMSNGKSRTYSKFGHFQETETFGTYKMCGDTLYRKDTIKIVYNLNCGEIQKICTYGTWTDTLYFKSINQSNYFFHDPEKFKQSILDYQKTGSEWLLQSYFKELLPKQRIYKIAGRFD